MDIVSSRSRLSKAFIELSLKKKIPATRWTGLERPNLSGNKFVQYIYCAFQEHANSEVQKPTDICVFTAVDHHSRPLREQNRTNHADQKQPQKINMHVMTSQYEIGGKNHFP